MDLKTLEYMGSRVDVARNIQRRIKELEHFLSYSEGRSSILIHDNHGNGPRIKLNEYERLASKAKAAIIREIETEIELLKQELEEL
ncbi:hypothetical protein P4H66_06220 [Paenibacillus dokdonensis]|uniref:Uncharacterized protein n=1 Tax=Paenibacillus dokdonensis TaxID=2567944 RepID=A0ABU6GI57_9BACL|nr:hypothetical protein [Paenibacillus dokdonensis]MEC0239450.1 hypothetical protein [Paenibacillus dokdonensis]